MAGVIRSSVSGQILVLNAGAKTGLYYSSGVLPEAAEIVWTTIPAFSGALPVKIGETVTIAHGVTAPAAATITAEVGTGATIAGFVSHLDLGEGLSGTVPNSLLGSELTVLLTAAYTSAEGLIYPPEQFLIRSGIVIQTDAEHDAFPADIAAADWTSIEVRSAISASGKRRVTLDADVVVPEGFELRWYSGTTTGGVGNDGVTTQIDPGETYTTNGQLLIGDDCYNVFFWKRLSDGVYQRAHPLSEQVYFVILGLIVTVPDGDFPPADQTLTSNTQAALMAAINARIASGSTATWIIDLPAGNYGAPNLSLKLLPAETILRSQDRALGARFTGLTGTNVENIHFQFCDFNRQGQGFTTNMIELYSVRNMGFSYNRLGAPEINRDSLGIGYVERIRYAVRIDNAATYGYSSDILIHENLFSGVMGEPIYLNGVNRAVVSNNVAENVCGDMMMFGHVTDIDVINNWGSRLHYPSWDPNARNGAGDFYHSDMSQMWTLSLSQRVRYIGNVFIAGKHPTLPGITRQGILVQGPTKDFLFRRNLIATNCFQGIWVERPNPGGHAVESNTLLRLIDLPSTQNGVYYRFDGSTVAPTWSLNVQQKSGSGWTGAFNIPVSGTDYTGSLAYYTNPRAEIGGQMSGFYDLRPVSGARTHWGYSGGAPDGAAERFREVIVDGEYPKIGSAAVAWKAWYDPKGQITS